MNGLRLNRLRFNRLRLNSSNWLQSSRSIVVIRKPVPPNPTKVYRNLKKFVKKTKKDTSDETSKANLLFLEIQSAVQAYNHSRNTAISVRDVLNSPEVIDKFLYSRNRDEVIVTVDIVYHTNEGDGVGFIPKSMYANAMLNTAKDADVGGMFDELMSKFTAVVVPKTLVGDRVEVKLGLHGLAHAEGLLLKVLRGSRQRRDHLVLCDKFNECNGCQYQMVRYEDQLAIKQETMEKAFRYFCPDMEQNYPGWDGSFTVFPSPRQYEYRTKFTPHYTVPRNRDVSRLKVGYNHVNKTREVVDIERCDLMGKGLNKAFAQAKKRVQESIPSIPDKKLGRQSTMYFRESVHVDTETGNTSRYCVSDHKTITEQVEDKLFNFHPASFFQTNSAILPSVLDYIRHHIGLRGKYKNLVDTYCGSGFFGIALAATLGPDGRVFGIEIDANAIEFANKNAALNGLSQDNVQFIQGSSEAIFSSKEFQESGILGSESVVIMDPSRKGSNRSFLQQLVDFQPQLVIYVSCNVNTQARDLQELFELQSGGYKIRDVVGFDFFPQTKQVETVVVLEKQTKADTSSPSR